ncbi:ankyrin [Mollisia scopiformis]|uniref:Ankyrin n=1 Tax=Mollisia scopiformis TaxID=149040 RepID=A0A194XGU3_MOLSC|nr:ankyrin [Mollisia scopiformis]KUJ19420.1 ankyrin [Mollisia scopiformis]
MEQIKSHTTQLLNDQDARLAPYVRAPPKSRRPARNNTSGVLQKKKTGLRTEGVAVRVAHKSGYPTLFNRMLGQLFVAYTGVPYLSQKCDSEACKRSQAPRIYVEYWFPLGFCWSQILQLQVGFQSNLGLQFSLKSLRRVPDSAQCVHYTMDGNIEGLKDLFKRGLASPLDVSSTRGYTLLREWAVYAKQYETVRFLAIAGSDPDYRPIAQTDNSARNKAFDALLQGALDKESEENVRCLTASSDWVEDQNFSKLHKITCGILPLDLEKEILDDVAQVDMTDAMGRTPLLWAAARGDHTSVKILLSHNADPNIVDTYLAPPVSYAADRGHTLCVRLLLEAGALAEPKLPPGVKLGSPLNCAARNARDPVLLKYLLTYGADVDSTGVDGNTALIHAARLDNVSFAILLLDNNANVNAISITAATPLTTAITYNSHRVLQLLLDRWDEYTECPRLKGPHLLQITALYADLETVKILTATDHVKLNYDDNFTLGDFAKRSANRLDVTDELIEAFDDLLLVCKQKPPGKQSTENLMEAGLLSRPPSKLAVLYETEKEAADVYGLENPVPRLYSDDSDEELVYEDAVEGSDGLDLNAQDLDEAAACCPLGFT